MIKYPCGFLAISTVLFSTSVLSSVAVEDLKNSIKLSNDLITINISKERGNVTEFRKGNKVNLVENITALRRNPADVKTFYLDYHTGVSGGGRGFSIDTYEVIEQSDDSIHVKFIGKKSEHLYLEYHYVIKEDVSGVYSYVVAKNLKDEAVRVAELRTVYRFDASIMNTVFNGVHSGVVPLYAELDKQNKVQDETWELPDGTVYSKYDYAGYMRDSNFWGVMGNGYGAWLITPSHEYFPGDPQMQELLVHQDGIMLNYMTGAHLGTPDMIAPEGWEKLYGPWLIYINEGTNEQLLSDAKVQASKEQSQWPYKWLKDENYSITRGSLTGKIKSDVPVEVILISDLDEEFDIATLGYNYNSSVDEYSEYEINNINPGKYVISVYSLDGNETGVLYEDEIEIGTEGIVKDIVISDSDKRVLWQIGRADRRSSEFKFSNERRNYKWSNSVPENLTYIIDKSNESDDWYYAQTKQGTWNISFDIDNVKDYMLNIAIASASNSGMSEPTTPKLTLDINGEKLLTFNYENDKAIYRGALQSGRYHNEFISIPKELLVKGDNNIGLTLEGGAIMYDTIVFYEE